MKAKRILSMLLAGLMVAGMSVSAFANETGTKTDDSTPPAQETPSEAPEGDYSVMPMIEDSEAPELVSVSLDKTEVDALGELTIEVQATDDISGVSYAYVDFHSSARDKNVQFFTGDEVTYDEETGVWTLTGSVKVGEFVLSGLYEIQYIHIYDKAGNDVRYRAEKRDYVEDDVLIPSEYIDLAFFIHNDGTQKEGDISSHPSDNELIDKINNDMSSDGTAYIHYGNNATLPKEVFSAIDNTEKTLVLTSDGIDWIFEGETIDANKIREDVDLKVSIEKDYASDSENADEIEDALGNKNSVIVSFADNGELPGPAKIRIKMDHVLGYVGTENLYVYYYNDSTGEFEEVASNLKITSDSYLEFEITHNSDYVIMNGAYVKPEDKPEDNTDNKPTWTPSYDDDEGEDVVVLEDDKEKITVEEFANGTVKANRKSASKGQKVTLTVTPDDGYVLKSLTVTNSKGKEVEVTEKNGKYYFEMPSTKVSIDAEFVKANVASAEKTNPETGAGDVVDVSVAFAVCSVICGAVLISKKR